MLRNRLTAIVLTLLGIAVVFYIATGLYLPSARRFIYGIDKGNGAVRPVEQRVTFLPWHQFYRLSFEKREGAAQTSGIVRITSREGVPVKLTYRLRFTISSARLSDVRHLVHDGWNGWLRRRVAEAVSAVTARLPIEEVASPNYDYGERRRLLRETVARHLARSGVTVTGFEIEQVEIEKESLLEFKQQQLRRNARGNYSRVALFSIDGADWELVSELVNDGRMPNLEALIEGGASGVVQPIQPPIAPLAWTSVATGVPPDRHGVIEFFDRRGHQGPVDARARMMPAAWEIAESFGRPATVVNWWGAWPPSTTGTYFGTPVQFLDRAVYPANLQPVAQKGILPEGALKYRDVARFLNVTETEYNESISAASPSDSIVLFRNALAKTWSSHRAAIDLYRSTRPTLFMMAYEGTDVVNHLFAPYHPPYREGINQTGFRRYWPAVANYYSEVDRLLGEWMKVLPNDTTVIVMSAYGMRWGKERPRTPPEGASSLAVHNRPGIFVAFGNNVARNGLRRPLSSYDIAPTLLMLLGLPPAKDMPGTAARWLFPQVEPVTNVSIASYQDLVSRKFVATEAAIDPRVYRARLSAVGHITDPNRVTMPLVAGGGAAARPITPQQWGEYAWYNNQAINLKREKKLTDAIDALETAISINPSRPVPYVNLAMLLLQRQQFTAAEAVMMKAVTLGLPNPERYIVDMAAWYRENDMPTRAIGLLIKAREMFPQSWLIAANLGSAMAASSRYTDAMAELERALAMNPSSPLVLNNLGALYIKKKDYGRAADYWNRSLAIDPRQPDIREAVNAVRTHL